MSALETKRPVGSAEASCVEGYEDAYSPEGYSGDEGNEPSDDHEPLPGLETRGMDVQRPEAQEGRDDLR